MDKIFKYSPNPIPKGYKVKEITCDMCYGTLYFSGKYGQTACDYCYKGKKYKLVRLYKKRKTKQIMKIQIEPKFRGKRIMKTKRESKFKGKRIDNGEWVYGYYYEYAPGSYIRTPKDDGGLEDFKVIPETVSEWTGENCKDKECYEGDILLVWNKERTTKFYYEVVFETQNCAFSALPINDPSGFGFDYEVLPVIIKSFGGAEIVGNKFEHKFLLDKIKKNTKEKTNN